MKDASFRVERGFNQSIGFTIYTSETGTTPKHLNGCTVWAFIGRIGSAAPVLSKELRLVDEELGQVALDLSPAESRLIPEGRRLDVEIELREGSLQIPVGRGRVTGSGGINLDA